jgi:hypothetical protein
VIGIFGVLASLIFVGLQMSQDRTIARATLYQMRADAVREMMVIRIEHRDIMLLVEQPVESLEPDEFLPVNSAIMGHISHFENTHNLYQLGMLDREQWDSDIPLICDMFDAPLVRGHWERSRSTYRASFVDEVERACEDVYR